MKYIERRKLLEQAKKHRLTTPVILISGLHGSGKSRFLKAIIRDLRSESPPVRIVIPGAATGNGRQLIAEGRALGVGPSALCIDNADEIEDLIPALQDILNRHTVTVFLTGRRTSELEKRLIPAFGDQLGILRLQPFSYAEYLEAHELIDSRQSLGLYAKTGGLPESALVRPDSPDIQSFLNIRAHAFVLTEIVEPKAPRNPTHIRLMLELVARHTGESLSAREACLAFAKVRTTISPQAALDYLEHCRESGLLQTIQILDLDEKKTMEGNGVWFFGDTGLRSAFADQEDPDDADRALENLTLLHLIDSGWRMARGRVGIGNRTREPVSFVCEKEGRRVYVQLIGGNASSAERMRRRQALLAIRDAWPKYLVDSEEMNDGSDGIQSVFIRDLLLSPF